MSSDSKSLQGIGRYVRELLEAIKAGRPDVEVIISFNAAMTDEAITARDLVGRWLPDDHIYMWQGLAQHGEIVNSDEARRRLSEAALAHHVATVAPDLALSASPFEGLRDRAVPYFRPASSPQRTAAIFFDAIPYRFADHYLPTTRDRACYKGRLDRLSQVDTLLAISRFAEAEARMLIPGVDIANIDAGISPEFMQWIDRPPDPMLMLSLDLRDPYMLYVGGLDWRKNVAQVVEAYRWLPPAMRDGLQFVIVGDYPADAEHRTRVRWFELSLPLTGLRMLGHVTEALLVQLYKHAALVIQPSLMEGFGLTALEAMICGTPVVVSKGGALPEVVGNPDVEFDPLDAHAIAASIQRVLDHSDFAQTVVDAGRVQAARYSWERSAGLAMAALERSLPLDSQSPTIDAQELDRLRRRACLCTGDLTIPDATVASFLAAAEVAATGPARLIVDVTSTARIDHATGIQRVVKRIVDQLGPWDAASSRVLGYCDNQDGFFAATLDGSGKPAFGGRGGAHPIRFRPDDCLLMLDSSWEFYREQGHVLRKARLQGARVISTLYDLIPLQLPAFCDAGMPPVFAEWFKVALALSTGFVCISRTVADDLLALLRAIHFPRFLTIGYWHLGADFSDVPLASHSTVPSCSSRSFLMVGTLEPRKGHVVALDAFDLLWNDGFDGRLVIAGKRGWNDDRLATRILTHGEYGQRLRWIESPDDEALGTLYRESDALIAASFGEGFGLPLVEAAHHGKPAIASDLAVFREVAHPSTTFFLAGSPVALVDAIRHFCASAYSSTEAAPSGELSLTWAQSARQLERVVLGGEWFVRYEPTGALIADAGNIGRVTMHRALETWERQFGLELQGAPILVDHDGVVQLTVKLTNRSDVLWSSDGLHDGRFGIRLGARFTASGNASVRDEQIRTRIPLVLTPGASIVLGVRLPTSTIAFASHALIGLVQEGVGWWGGDLDVQIDDALHAARDFRVVAALPKT